MQKSLPYRVSLALVIAAGATACKKDEKPAEQEAKAGEQKAEVPGTTPAGDALAGEVLPATPLQRGAVLGHVLVARPSAFLQEVRTQLVPEQQRAMLDEGMLRGLAGMQLGERSALAQKIDLQSTFGCAWAELPAAEAGNVSAQPPVACVMGYQGGADALVTDLGSEGKEADAQGHLAVFKAGENQLYIDKLGDAHVAVSTNPKAFEVAKDYLQQNVLDRGSKVASDIELVAYVDEVFRAYPDLEAAFKQQTQTVGDSPMAGLQAKGNENALKSFKEMEQLSAGVALEKDGFHIRYAAFPVAGSDYEKQISAYAAGPLQPDIVKQLPASSWMVFGASFDSQQLLQNEAMIDQAAAVWAELLGRPAAELKAGIVEYMTLFANSYEKNWAGAIAGDAQSLGGIVSVVKVKDAEARQKWQTWVTSLDPKKALGPKASKYVTWSFKPDVLTVDGAAVDRWLLEPTAAAQKELRKELKENYDTVAKKTDNMKLVIDRVEVDGNAVFIVAPGTSDALLKQAVAAVKGQESIAKNPGFDTILSGVNEPSSVFGVDAQAFATWARGNFPEAQKIPADIGADLSDIHGWTSYSQKGAATGDFVISQAFIDEIVKLASQASQGAGAQPGQPAVEQPAGQQEAPAAN